MRPWGYHLLLDLGSCNPVAVRSKPVIVKFTKTLVKNIDMVAYGAPQVVRFGTDDKMGYTLVQLIETSNITAHFCESTNDAYLDIFSCKPFEPQKVLNLVKEVFEPTTFQTRFVLRRAVSPSEGTRKKEEKQIK